MWPLFPKNLDQRFVNLRHLLSLFRFVGRARQSRPQQHYAARKSSNIGRMQQNRIHKIAYVGVALHCGQYHGLQMLRNPLVIVHSLPGEDLVQYQPIAVAVHLGAQLALRYELWGNVRAGTVHAGYLHTRVTDRHFARQTKIADFGFVVGTQ